MRNTVIYENPMRKKLKQAMCVLVLLAIMFAVALVIINLINKQTYNGKTVATEGIVTKVAEEDDTTYVYLDNSDKKYNTNPISDEVENLNALKGKNVTIYTPEEQFGNGAPMILGLTVEGKEVVNTDKLIEKMRNQNTIGLIVMAVLCGVSAAGTCAFALWRINVPREKEYPLAQKYVEYYAEKQPNCPEMKYWKTFMFVWVVVMLLPIIAISIWDSIEEQSLTINLIFVGITCAIALGGIIASFLMKRWIAQKNVEFYAEHYPFDFADISHIRMKKDVREKIEKELREDLELHPHYQGDGGNGYLAKFTDHGVELYVPDFWDEEPTTAAKNEQKIDVPAEDVFGLQQNSTDDKSYAPERDEIEQNNSDNDYENKTPVLTLTYEEANFEAVPFFNKPRPMFVVIKSRLEPNSRYPEELVNDLHFLLDVNLLKTLQTFSVPVENLDNILQNKKELMTDALAKAKQKNSDISQ